MKILKISLITLSSLFLVLYLSFLFILPNAIDINVYEKDIQKAVQENSNFKVDTQGLKLSTGWNLSAGVKADRIDLFYANNEKFGQLKNVELKLSLIPLIFKKIQLDSINIDNLILRMKVEDDGTFYIEKFLKTETKKTEETPEVAEDVELPFGLELSDVMPLINVKKYTISLIDMPTDKFYTVEGKDFAISDFVLEKRIKILAKGDLILDKRKQISYDLKIASKFLPEIVANTENTEPQKPFDVIEVLKILNKIDLTSDIKTDIVLKGSLDNLKIDGTLDVSKLSLKVQNKKLPESTVKLAFKGDKVVIDTDLNISNTENISADGYFKHGKSQYVDLIVKSNKIDLKNAFNMVNSMLPVFGVKNINGISANGTLKANFNIKSDFKKIASSGYLTIDDANVSYNLYNIAVKNINSHIDFSRNQINIKDTKALVNGAPISLSGKIDTNAYANLNLTADKLPIKGLVATFGLINVLKENNINSGLVTLNANLKGNLTKSKPTIEVLLENVNIYNKPSKVKLILSNAKSNINIDKENKILGDVILSSLKVISNDFGTISLPSTKLSFDEKDINITKSDLYFNNSKFNVKGMISNYIDEKKNSVNVEVYGLVVAKDIKNLLPKDLRKDIVATGKMPVIVKVVGNLKQQDITAQMLANRTNYISIVDISSLAGRTSLINVAMKLANNTLKISDISLNVLGSNIGLTEDFKANMRTATPIATVKGSIHDIQAKYPNISNVVVKIPQRIAFSIPMFKNSNIQMNGDISVNGSTKAPIIFGNLQFANIYLPTLKTSMKDLNVNLGKTNTTVTCSHTKIADSELGFNAVVDSNFSKCIKIKSMNLNASMINLDSLITALSNLPQNSVGQGTDIGITLSNGKGKIETFKMGGLVASNISADYVINKNILKISNIVGSAYGGKIAGSASYNLIFGNLELNLQGRTLNAEPAIRGFTGMKNLIHGFLDFDTQNIRLVAGTETQMMQSLKGDVKFLVSDGQMGTLGKLENLLYAQNILSNNILKTTLGGVAKAVSIKKTGDFKYIKGSMDFGYGWANILSIQTSGPAMSMYIKGKYNLLNNNANVIVLGRLSNDVVQILGPIGDFSVNKLLSYIPKIGNVSSALVSQMTTSRNKENLANLPNLTPMQSAETKEFKVSISGAVDSTKSIKYFKWISNPEIQNVDGTSEVLPTQPAPTSMNNYIDAKLKGATQGLVKKLIPSSTDSTTAPNVSTPTPSAPAKTQGVADFIESLPDLN